MMIGRKEQTFDNLINEMITKLEEAAKKEDVNNFEPKRNNKPVKKT